MIHKMEMIMTMTSIMTKNKTTINNGNNIKVSVLVSVCIKQLERKHWAQ